MKTLVSALLAIALFLPGTGAAGVALVTLIGLFGAYFPASYCKRAIAWGSRATVGWRQDALLAASLLAVGVAQLGQLTVRGGLNRYDWGPHHALLRHLVDGLQAGQIPRWVQSVSTGDSPYELYALLPYYLAAKVALLCGTEDLSLILIRSAVAIHVLGAITGAWLARRLVNWGWALALGLALLYEAGSVWGGGPEGMFHMGVVHSSLANALWPICLMAVLAGLKRPGVVSSLGIWVSVAFVAACHPLGLVAALATVVGLGMVAVLAQDIPRHRALAVGVHICLGVALVAFVWMPFGARLLQYGVQYPFGGRSSWELFALMLKSSVPEGSSAPIVFAGYLGLVSGVVSRRAAPILLASFSGILLLGLFDQLYVLFDLLPSFSGSRLQTPRLASVARVGLLVMGAHFLSQAVGIAPRLASGVIGLRRRPVWEARVLGALVALMVAGSVRVALPYYDRQAAQLRRSARHTIPDPAGFAKLVGWAREQQELMTPGTWGRLLHEDPGNSFAVYHLNAQSGLPGLKVGYVPMLFLRDRIENTSASSLRRFNVRWVFRFGSAPKLGDKKTQKSFGHYYLRELTAWDGQFARIESGQGQVVTTQLDNEHVQVELSDTQEPALVALGMGYYPRWRAYHEQEGQVPVYAMPSVQKAKLNIPVAWLPPGKTVFRVDGALPSDGAGRGLSILASLILFGMLAVSASESQRGRYARYWAHGRRWLRRYKLRALSGGGGLVVATLAAWGVRTEMQPAAVLQVGSEVWPGASVEWKRNRGQWTSCPYSPLHGAYRCPGPVLIQDSVDNLLNNVGPSHAFATPVIRVATSSGSGEVRIVQSVLLAGEYWAATNGIEAELAVEGEMPIFLGKRQQTLAYAAGKGVRRVTIQAKVLANSVLTVAVVRKARLEPERHYPRAPPESFFSQR